MTREERLEEIEQAIEEIRETLDYLENDNSRAPQLTRMRELRKTERDLELERESILESQ